MKYPVYNYELQKWEDNKELLISQLEASKNFLGSKKAIQVGAITKDIQADAISQIEYELNQIKNF